MSAVARFDLKMDVEEKEVISRAAALVGTTMGAFVRMGQPKKRLMKDLRPVVITR
ncbi:MAG: DUF1778 domain-containing protein [Ferrovum myxofaciens]|uniref:type II toxin -antitoxin system TacA 1-like antitoxin n=1 Tax=Ferrovum myxofaciens TaxID=416213 RepID=UPI0023551CD2|nr:DUF1778 domain-containing protein [Ferrovum myxofaciens]QKE40493.1 MAG: DUF1778 domain-containing protein [Ferrovum myxofaciens]